MAFSANIFLFAFSPLFLACYYLTPWRAKSALILIFSLAFYAWRWPDLLALLVGVTSVSYPFALAIGTSSEQARRHRLLTAGVSLNLLALGYFKYANFGIASFNVALHALGFNAIKFTRVLLPIGLSFYIFHAISYRSPCREPTKQCGEHRTVWRRCGAGRRNRYFLLLTRQLCRPSTTSHLEQGAQRSEGRWRLLQAATLYLKDEAFRSNKPKVLVWEMPERLLWRKLDHEPRWFETVKLSSPNSAPR